MAVDGTELRKGLAETRRYILSHHPPAEYDRCYSLAWSGTRLHICARCAGIYPGIATGVGLGLWIGTSGVSLPILALLALPALIDWAVTATTMFDGRNPIRTGTGALLGIGYGLGLVMLLFDGDVRVLMVGGVYALLAGLLLVRYGGPTGE